MLKWTQSAVIYLVIIFKLNKLSFGPFNTRKLGGKVLQMATMVTSFNSFLLSDQQRETKDIQFRATTMSH